jgi:hypothetical protein
VMPVGIEDFEALIERGANHEVGGLGTGQHRWELTSTLGPTAVPRCSPGHGPLQMDRRATARAQVLEPTLLQSQPLKA